ncbi:hypothetical protein ACFLQG_00645 [Candidatus Zixiibacteriota bacterium]
MESGRATTSDIICTLLSGGPSLVWIRGLLVIVFVYFLVLKIISSLVLSPTAISLFSRGALVQPQPGITFNIFRLSSPDE